MKVKSRLHKIVDTTATARWSRTAPVLDSTGYIRMCNRDDIDLHNMMPNPAGNKIIITTTP